MQEIVEYKLEDGEYILYLNGEKTHNLGKNVGISYSFWLDSAGHECGTVYNISDVQQIKELHLNKCKRLNYLTDTQPTINLISRDMLNSLYYKVIQPSIEDLNALIHNSTYIVGYHKTINYFDLDCLNFELYKKDLSYDYLYDLCKQLREDNISSQDIINVIETFIDDNKFYISEEYIELMHDILDTLTGFCNKKYSLE